MLVGISDLLNANSTLACMTRYSPFFFIPVPMKGGISSLQLQQIRFLTKGSPVTSGLGSATSLRPDQELYLHLPGSTGFFEMEPLSPEPAFAFRLWQLFLDRVNPLTKLVHVPSLQPHIVEASACLSVAPVGMRALLFSICAIAVVSLSDAECASVFSQSRNGLSRQFMSAAQRSLIEANFMQSCDMALLQAFLLYLVCIGIEPLFNRSILRWCPRLTWARLSFRWRIVTTWTHSGFSVQAVSG